MCPLAPKPSSENQFYVVALLEINCDTLNIDQRMEEPIMWLFARKLIIPLMHFYKKIYLGSYNRLLSSVSWFCYVK